MPTSSPPAKKTIDIQANATAPRGATIRLTVEYRIRPPKANERGPVRESVDMEQDSKVNMGEYGRYGRRSEYSYGNLIEQPSKLSTTVVRDKKTNEQSSEDEKSTSSEEVFFEEWTEQFRCRRTDEYDQQTNKLLRTTIDETSDRIKGDVIKEQYKEKNTRIKSRTNKDKHRTSTNIYEEITQPPRPWTSQETYTTEVTASAPSVQQQQQQRQQEQVVTEEYHVEFETPNQTQTNKSTEQFQIPTTPIRQNTDWKNDLKQKYSPSSDEDDNQSQTPTSGNEPTYSRVGELRNAFESTTVKDERNKFQTPVKTGFTEQRRRIFEEQEWTPKTNERLLSETHTVPSTVNERVSHIENRTGFEVTPQTSIDTRYRAKQVISSIDSEIGGPAARPIYQSTPKSVKQKVDDDAGHESEDELSDSNQPNNFRRHSSKTRYRDFTQTTSQPIESTHSVQHMVSKFNESNVENVLSHLPSSKGKGILIELSQTPSKSNLTSDSGVFDSSTWRQNVSTSIADDVTRSRDTGIHMDSTNTTDLNKHEIHSNQYQQPTRIVRRQLTNTSRQPQDYEYLRNYQSQIPITTQSRTIQPYVVDEIETIETETQVECNIQRTNQTNETTKTERIKSTSPTTTPHQSPLKATLQTNTTIQSPQETLHSRRVLLNERPQYYQPATEFQPIKHEYSNEDSTQTMRVTSLSPTHQFTIGKSSPNEVTAIVNIPQLAQQYERPKLHYQRVYASSYRPPIQQQQRIGRYESRNDYSTPIRSSSCHRDIYDEQRQSPHYQSYNPITRYHSNSLGNLFGPNLEFEIEIEKRPPQQPEQPTSIAIDQPSRAIITTSKDGRVSIQNVAAYPGHTVIINSDYHASDRSLNRSSGYFSSSDDQSSAYNNYSLSHLNQINDIVSRPSANFHDTIDQIDALYNNLDIQTNNQQQHGKINRRKLLAQNPNEYSKRFTSTGFQQQPTNSDHDQTFTNLITSTPIRPSHSLSSSGILTDYGTPGSISPPSHYSSRQNIIVQQNRLNNQSQIVQRNRSSIKQMKQKSASNKRRNGNYQGQFSDDDDEEDDYDHDHTSRVYHFQ